MDYQNVLNRAREAVAVRKLKDSGELDLLLPLLESSDGLPAPCPTKDCFDWAINRIWSDGGQHNRRELKARFATSLQITSMPFAELMNLITPDDRGSTIVEAYLRLCKDDSVPLPAETLVAAVLLELETFPDDKRSALLTALNEGGLEAVVREISQDQADSLLMAAVRRAVHEEVDVQLQNPFDADTRQTIHEAILKHGKDFCRAEVDCLLEEYGLRMCRLSMSRLIWRDVAVSIRRLFAP